MMPRFVLTMLLAALSCTATFAQEVPTEEQKEKTVNQVTEEILANMQLSVGFKSANDNNGTPTRNSAEIKFKTLGLVLEKDENVKAGVLDTSVTVEVSNISPKVTLGELVMYLASVHTVKGLSFSIMGVRYYKIDETHSYRSGEWFRVSQDFNKEIIDGKLAIRLYGRLSMPMMGMPNGGFVTEKGIEDKVEGMIAEQVPDCVDCTVKERGYDVWRAKDISGIRKSTGLNGEVLAGVELFDSVALSAGAEGFRPFGKGGKMDDNITETRYYSMLNRKFVGVNIELGKIIRPLKNFSLYGRWQRDDIYSKYSQTGGVRPNEAGTTSSFVIDNVINKKHIDTLRVGVTVNLPSFKKKRD